jgi:hypothetical protein
MGSLYVYGGGMRRPKKQQHYYNHNTYENSGSKLKEIFSNYIKSVKTGIQKMQDAVELYKKRERIRKIKEMRKRRKNQRNSDND